LYPGDKQSVRRYIHVKDAAYASVKILSNKYKNKCILLTGKKSVKIMNFLKILKRILNIKSKIKFMTKKRYGHYISKPAYYKILYADKFHFGKMKDFEKEVKNLTRRGFN